MEIGFCGPGLMGAPMIRHLLGAGHAVHVWNRTRAKAEALGEAGAQVVDTPRELAAKADVVLLCVADAGAVEEVVFGAAGVLGDKADSGGSGGGDGGAGQTIKLCNQAIVTSTVAAIAEAVSLAQRSGIDAARLTEALAGGWADSVLLQTFVPRMTQAGLPPIGAFKTFQKDVDTVAATACETGTPMPVSATVQQLLRLGAAMGLGEADLSAFIDVLQTPRGACGRADGG